jgi:GNAT superfamily N-acetyltransferase
MDLSFQIISTEKLTDKHRELFGDLLEKQGKLTPDPPFNEKADRCKLICIVEKDNETIAIGAIKPKTKSDFKKEKVNIPELEKLFEWELGYIYTTPDNEGLGIASNMVKLLVKEYGDENLMASTEINKNPAMVRILEKNGFRLFGQPWETTIPDESYFFRAVLEVQVVENKLVSRPLSFGKKR